MVNEYFFSIVIFFQLKHLYSEHKMNNKNKCTKGYKEDKALNKVLKSVNIIWTAPTAGKLVQ